MERTRRKRLQVQISVPEECSLVKGFGEICYNFFFAHVLIHDSSLWPAGHPSKPVAQVVAPMSAALQPPDAEHSNDDHL